MYRSLTDGHGKFIGQSTGGISRLDKQNGLFRNRIIQFRSVGCVVTSDADDLPDRAVGWGAFNRGDVHIGITTGKGLTISDPAIPLNRSVSLRKKSALTVRG